MVASNTPEILNSLDRLGRILIVDDEAANRVIVERRLKASGYETLCVPDGEQALAAMDEWHPDLVLLDLMMPGLSGFDVLERQAARPAIADIPVVMVSAADDEGSRVRGLELGAVDYVSKPFSAPELQIRVKNLIRLYRQQAELNRLNAELNRLNVELGRLAVSDPLTGVANRRYFESRWDLELERCDRYRTPLSLVLIDIDHFKRVNDTHGHATGDAVLKSVAHALTGCARDVDLLARIGGEEFAFILPHTDADGAYQVGERVRTAVESTDLTAFGLTCTASVGVAGSTSVALNEIMEAADRALYRAKAAGRNRVELWRGPVPV